MAIPRTLGPGASRRVRPLTSMNHYEVLGVTMSASPTEVRQAYLGAARRHHPDFHADADESTRNRHAQKMQVINQAWAVLGNQAERAQYDLTFRSPNGGGPGRANGSSGPVVPPGKSWTPRTGDDDWQHDYQAWADEDERLRPDRPEPRTRGVLAIVPVALFGLAVAGVFLGSVLSARPLVAAGIAAGIFSAVLFVVLPVVEMSRGRHHR